MANNETVMRYQIADYLNTGTDSTEVYSLMGVGFNTLDENPSAQSDGKTYIHQKSQTSHIKGYQTQFPFDTDLIASETAVMALYDIGRNQKTGADAELDYIRVELFRTITAKENTFQARNHFPSSGDPAGKNHRRRRFWPGSANYSS